MKLGFAFLCLGGIMMGSVASSPLASFKNDVIIPHRLLAEEAPNCTCVNETIVVCEEEEDHGDEGDNVTVAEARAGHTMDEDDHTDHEEKHWEEICVCVAGVLDCEDDHGHEGEGGCHCHDGEIHCDDPELEADCHCHGDEPHCDDHGDDMTNAPSAAPSLSSYAAVGAIVLATSTFM